MKVLNFGSLNIDYVYSVDHIVNPGETILSDKLSKFAGGKGLNQSIALARAGAKVFHAGCIGKDDGSFLKDILSEENVSVEFISSLENINSGHAIIQVDKNGQNSILLFGGANQKVTKEYIDSVLNEFVSGDYLLIQNEISELDYLIRKAYEKGLFIVLNPSPINETLLNCDLDKVSMFVMNEIEASEILNIQDISFEDEEKIKNIPSRFKNKEIIITFGSKGSVYVGKDGFVKQKAVEVNAIDTTAAGDTYTGYVIGELLRNSDIKEAIKTATLASAITCTRNGAAPSIPLLSEVKSQPE